MAIIQGDNIPFPNVLSSSNDGATGDAGIVLQSPKFTPCKRGPKDNVYILLAFYGQYVPLVAAMYRKCRGETRSAYNLYFSQVFLDNSNDLVEAVVGGIHWDNGTCFQSVLSVGESHDCKYSARCLGSR